MVESTRNVSTARATIKSTTCKITLGFVFFLNVCLVLAYMIHNPFSAIDVKAQETISKIVPASLENRLRTWCESVKTPNKQEMTSTILSKIYLAVIPRSGRIIIKVETVSKKNASKVNGGDIILVFAKQSMGDGRVPGTVVDHRNGSYTGVIKIFWRGKFDVYVKLASSVENTCLRVKALQKYGNMVYTLTEPYGLRAVFIKDKLTDMTPCNTNDFIYGSMNVCNFTSLNGGMSWFCGNPALDNLTCVDLTSFSLGPFSRSIDSVSQKDKIQDPGHGMFRSKMAVNISSISTRNTLIPCNKRSPFESWKEPTPTGYYFKKHWVQANCRTSLRHTIYNYRSCLRNKTLVMLGDSTVRQFVNFFLTKLLNLETNIGKGFTFGSNFETYHGHNTFTKHGITIIYKKQAMPLHFSGNNIPIKDILSFPQILDSVAASNLSSSSMVVLLNYHTHFSAFPPVKYRERLRYLAEAITRLVKRKPLAKVFFKGPSVCISNSKWWDPRISLLFEDILKEEFADIMDRVTYLNAWDIAVAHNVEDVHPKGNAFMSLIHSFMSFVC